MDATPRIAVARRSSLPSPSSSDAAPLLREARGAAPLPDRVDAAVRAQAARDPHACAIRFEGRAFSYGWLDAVSDRMAAALQRRGVERGAVVGVHMHRTPRMIAALVACLKAGAAYLPLDPDFPRARLELILAEAGPDALVTELSLDDALRGRPDLPRLLVDDLSTRARPPSAVAGASPDDLAYVIYTSGSTGAPKGVEIPHRAVMNMVRSFAAAPGFGPGDRMLAAATTAFDLSVAEIFPPLVLGGELVLAPRGATRDPQALAALLDAGGCTVAQATPSLWRFLLDGGWAGKPDLVICAGGEALTRDLADRLLGKGRELWNLYGPTETTVWSALHRVTAGTGPVPIGRPFARTELRVLAEGGREAAEGEVGELCIGGAGLARGYRGRPELTRERFILHGGRRLYRTGDLARRRSDGALECLGRTDHQVKIRGFRIELGEVEAALSAQESVSAAAVVARERPDGERELVAYVTGVDGAAPDPAALRDALRLKLPAYMTPARFVTLDALPLTPTGKVDRKALPEVDAIPKAEPEARSAEGLSDTERRLAAIWSEVLGGSEVGPHDNFFDLGGYSLLTVRLVARVRETFGRSLSMADLFACRDLAAMAARLETPDPEGPVPTPLQPLGERPPLFWLDAGPQLRPLAALLAPDQPLLGVNVDPADEAGLDGGADLVDALADLLATRLKRFHPRGPFLIGGWCRWGSVAHAVAQRLHARGEHVALLVLLDTVNHGSVLQRLRRLTRGARRERGPEGSTDLGQRVEAASVRYRPATYGGDVLLLRASDADHGWDGFSGWADAVAGRLEAVDLPGDHRGLLQPPNVQALAGALAAALREAQTPAAATPS